MNYSQKISNTHILDNNLKIKLILLQVLLVTVILILPFYTLSAQPIHSIDVIAGAALNFDSNVTFHQTGEEDITLTGQYITKPFDDPYYLGLRFNFNIAHHIWELQFLHHKVYLTNTTEEVQHFEITHGFNTLTLHHRFVYDEFNLRIGAGVVLPHTESRGYFWMGLSYYRTYFTSRNQQGLDTWFTFLCKYGDSVYCRLGKSANL
jgi:hypothetical protein